MKIQTPPTKSMCEARLSRLFQYVEDRDKSFAIISACRNERNKAENEAKTEELKADVRSKGFGYIELKGGYVETDETMGIEVEVTEDSVLIPKIPKDEAIELGQKYGQESILFKDSKSMAYILTSGSNLGKTDMEFVFGAGKQNFSVDDPINKYFSRLTKGPHANKKISFRPVIYERSYTSDNIRQALSGGKAKPIWEKVLTLESASRSMSHFHKLLNDDNKAFAIVSPCRSFIKHGNNDILELNDADNAKRLTMMSHALRRAQSDAEKHGFKIGFTGVRGGYKDVDEPTAEPVYETSYLITISQISDKNDMAYEASNYLRGVAIALGETFEQDSILFKDGEFFGYIGTNKDSIDITKDGKQYIRTPNYGKVLDKFDASKTQISAEDIFTYFTKLKGANKISFVESMAINQHVSNGFSESFINRQAGNWLKIYPQNFNESGDSFELGIEGKIHTFEKLSDHEYVCENFTTYDLRKPEGESPKDFGRMIRSSSLAIFIGAGINTNSRRKEIEKLFKEAKIDHNYPLPSRIEDIAMKASDLARLELKKRSFPVAIRHNADNNLHISWHENDMPSESKFGFDYAKELVSYIFVLMGESFKRFGFESLDEI